MLVSRMSGGPAYNKLPLQPLLLPEPSPAKTDCFWAAPVPGAAAAPAPVSAAAPAPPAGPSRELLTSMKGSYTVLSPVFLSRIHFRMNNFPVVLLQEAMCGRGCEGGSRCTPGWNSSSHKPDPEARFPCYTEHILYRPLTEQRNLHDSDNLLFPKKSY